MTGATAPGCLSLGTSCLLSAAHQAQGPGGQTVLPRSCRSLTCPQQASLRASTCFCLVASRVWYEQALQEGGSEGKKPREMLSGKKRLLVEEPGEASWRRSQESQWAEKGWGALGKQGFR